MCDANLFGVIGMGMTLFGGMQAAQAQRSAANAQAALHDENARLAEEAARAEEGRRDRNVVLLKRDIASTYGAQRSAIGSRGISLDYGSGLDILADTAMLGKEDVDAMNYDFNTNVWKIRNQANLDRYQAGVTRTIGEANATSTLLSTAGSAMTQGMNLFGGGGYKKTSPTTSIATSTQTANNGLFVGTHWGSYMDRQGYSSWGKFAQSSGKLYTPYSR